jgi:hypothetical protein
VGEGEKIKQEEESRQCRCVDDNISIYFSSVSFEASFSFIISSKIHRKILNDVLYGFIL